MVHFGTQARWRVKASVQLIVSTQTTHDKKVHCRALQDGIKCNVCTSLRFMQINFLTVILENDATFVSAGLCSTSPTVAQSRTLRSKTERRASWYWIILVQRLCYVLFALLLYKKDTFLIAQTEDMLPASPHRISQRAAMANATSEGRSRKRMVGVALTVWKRQKCSLLSNCELT